MRTAIAKALSTVFYLGYFPFAAGSIASAIGGLLAISMGTHVGVFASVFAVVAVMGFWASGPVEEIANEKDPSCIVIDEVAGAMLAFFCLPAKWPVLFTAFFLFRAFDMFEVPPADWFTQRKGGTGVMMDDIVAGVYTNIVMHIAIRLTGIA